MTQHFSLRQLFLILTIAFCILLGSSALSAWTGPSATAPNGNVAAPINVGNTDQVKNAGLSVNALAVFGSEYVQNRLGVGVIAPVVAIETTGSIKIGNGGEVCQAVTEGAVRYNVSGKYLEFCNGTVWSRISTSSAPVSPPPPQLLYGGTHNSTQCASVGGTLRSIGGGNYLCERTGAACWSGWTRLSNWGSTQSAGCGSSAGQCPAACVTGSHAWSNVATESCSYVSRNLHYPPKGEDPYCQSGSTVTCNATLSTVGCY